MNKKNLSELFDIKETKKTSLVISENYTIFNDKILLDTIKRNIIPNIINDEIPKGLDFKSYIDKELNKILLDKKLSKLEYDYIYNLIKYEIEDYGPLTELLKDDNITKIMVNSPNEIYIEIDNKIVKDESISFLNGDHIYYIIKKILKSLNIDINKVNSVINIQTLDGAKINIIMPPISFRYPIITIKKYKKDINTIEDLIRKGTLTPYMARFLEACVKAKLNIVICGKINSGKTTLLNLLANLINEDERIITIQNTGELKLSNSHVISLLTNENNYKNEEKITIKSLINNALYMNPDRIIIDDIIKDEIYDVIEANNMGFNGYLASIRANNLTDCLLKIESNLLSNNIDNDLVKDYIKNNIDIIVNIKRLKDGRIKVTSISEIIDTNDQSEIRIKEIFAFKETGIINSDTDGSFVLYKYIPKIYDKIIEKGINDLDDIFDGNNDI